MKIRIDPADKAFSLWVRTLAGGYCEKCKVFKGIAKLEASHMFGRRYNGTRFEKDNVFALCFTCHNELDENYCAKDEFHLSKVSGERIEELRKKTNEYHKLTKRDKKEIQMYYKEKLRELVGG